MKVALLHYDFKEYTVGLANALAEHLDLIVIHPDRLGKVVDGVLNSRIHVHNFTKPRARYPQNIVTVRRLIEFMRCAKPDLLHVQATGDPWFDLSLLYARLPPMVTTIHDVFPHPGDRFRVPGASLTGCIPRHRSKHLIVHTPSLKASLSESFKIPDTKVSVIAHGELGGYYRHFANDKPIEREPSTLLFFGRIWPYKGLQYLLAAMPLIAAQIPEVKLIIAGRGESLKTYFPQGVEPQRYEILDGYIPQEEVAPLFQRSTLTVLPYIEASQSGVAAISYGFGTPVIASRTGGLSEMVRDGEDGLLVPPADPEALAEAIVRLLRDPELQRRMQAAANQRCATDLNWSNIARETLAVYHKTLEQK